MGFIYTITENIVSPAILFFVLGLTAGLFKSDMKIPNSISRYLAIYLMMAIGFKGGVSISNTPQMTPQIITVILTGIGMSFLQPFIGYGLLKITTKIDNPTSAAIGAHYGSVSVITFATAVSFLKTNEIHYAGYIVAILALMEAPAILSGLFIAHKTTPKLAPHTKQEKKLVRDIFTNGAILLLFGSFLIGWATGQKGLEKVEGFLVTPFQGILCLFLLDMGLMVSKNFHYLKSFTWGLVSFGFYMPILGATAGLILSYIMKLDVGTGTLFTVLCASASYIAVPAAMKLALPEAKAAIYVPMSLAITFPFNVIVGIPLYFLMAKKILSLDG